LSRMDDEKRMSVRGEDCGLQVGCSVEERESAELAG
jgi:hypothetical protein